MEIDGDLFRSSGQRVADTDWQTLVNVTYSYFVTHPSELRHAVRKDIDDYLAGLHDDKEPVEDTRPITEQVEDLMDDWAAFEAQLS